MQISATMVKELRERTGAGMMDCKKALQQSGGDIEAAIDQMRKSGVARAAKKAGRIAAEGMLALEVSADGSQAVLLEVNCETDFVARDDNFQGFARRLAAAVLERETVDGMENIDDVSLGNGEPCSVEEARQQLVVKLGENISVRRFTRMKNAGDGALGVYLHGGRIGVIVALSVNNPGLAKDLAMHIAASNPLSVDERDLPPDILQREKEIHLAQARQSGKPDDIVEKMVAGRMKKFLRENTLSGQAFVKDPDTSVAALLQKNKAAVSSFIRYEVGEGIDRKSDDFVADVMQQAGLNNNGKE